MYSDTPKQILELDVSVHISKAWTKRPTFMASECIEPIITGCKKVTQ